VTPAPTPLRPCAASLRAGLSLLVLFLGGAAVAAPPPPSRMGALTARELAQGFRDGRILAKPRPELVATIDALEQADGVVVTRRFERFGQVRVIGVAAGDTVPAAVARLRATGRYLYVEPDYVRHGLATAPNDPQFPAQWALHNTGANGGIAGADIDAEGGWGVITSTIGSKALVAILDSGALTTHQDLTGDLWVNPTPGTTTSFSDGGSDNVSETDSLYGLNAVAMTGLPTDDLGHGTHVSGIAGAVGNNGLGVSGVAWSTQMMELKFIDSTDSGSTSDELPCIEYAIAHKVTVINASFGDTTFSEAEMDAIHAAGGAGIIFVCAAGNAGENADISPFFPTDYPLDNIIAVGATDNRDQPASFSNYGSGSVELFAPGDNILSTYFSSDSSYGYLSGTSMAAPFVTGTVALLQAKFPNDTYRETINRVLNSVDLIPALAGRAQTGGRLNLAAALSTAASTPPNDTFATRTTLVGLDPYTRSNNADAPLTPELGTPALASGTGHSLWWQWTAPNDAEVEIDTSGTGGGDYPGGSTYATALGVYTGTTLGGLTPVQTSLNFGTEPVESGNGATESYSEVSFHTTAGVTYQINVQGQAGASGQTILAINTTPDYDSIATPRVLTGPSVAVLDANVNATRSSGEPTILGHSGGHSLWYAWTAAKTGPAQLSAYSYDFIPMAAVYTGTTYSNLALVSAAAGGAMVGTSTDTSSCLCSFQAVAGTTYLFTVDGTDSNQIGEFTLTVDDALWQAVTQDAVTTSPSVGPDGTVYVGGNDDTFYAYSPTGAVKWTYTAGSVFDSSSAAVGPDGTIYATNSDGNIYAFNPDGSVKWKYTLPGSGVTVTCSPTLSASGVVYAHGSDGNLYAVSATGALVWTLAVPGDSYAAPTLAPDGTIYISTDSGVVYAVNPNGTQKWTFTDPVAGDSIYTAAPVDAAGNIYVGTLSGSLYSLDATGALRWTYTTGNGITSAPALANGSVYFGGYDGNLYALTTAGALEWKYPLGTQVRASGPAVDAGGNIYIGCYDHLLYEVSSSGSLVRTYATADLIRSSPVISGTTLLFGSEDHKVYAFSVGAGPAAGDWPMYQYDNARLGRAAVAFTAEPTGESVAVGGTISLAVAATGPGSLSYQWNLNGSAIAGATGAAYTLAGATAAAAGSYTVTVTGPTGSATSPAATVSVGASAGRLVNLSARANVGTGGNILIAGFVIQGSGSKTLVLRGVGPTLAVAPFNLTGVLTTPQLTLLNATGGTLQTDASWGGGTSLADAFAAVGAFSLAADSADSALEATLPAGAYTSQVAGLNSSGGIALAEIYDADSSSTTTSLINISARANVGTGGNILIAGFVIEGSQPATVLLRGIGPTLGTSTFGLTGVLAQPEIELFNSSSVMIQSNSNWGGASTLVSAFSVAGAFPLAADSGDAAMIATLPAGSYTLELVGQNGTTGIGLVEVYLLQ